MRPSPEWNVLLAPFESLFTQPGYRYFCAFVLVFAHIDQRLWVTQVVLSGLVQKALHQLLSLPPGRRLDERGGRPEGWEPVLAPLHHRRRQAFCRD